MPRQMEQQMLLLVLVLALVLLLVVRSLTPRYFTKRTRRHP